MNIKILGLAVILAIGQQQVKYAVEVEKPAEISYFEAYDDIKELEMEIFEENAVTETESEVIEEVILDETEAESATEEDILEEPETDEEWISLGEFKITAYCGGSCCNGQWAGQTSTGVKPTPHRTIAVAPWIIPYGSEVQIEGLDFIYVAEDTGGFANRNDHQIDLLMGSHAATCEWGVQYLEVWIKAN